MKNEKWFELGIPQVERKLKTNAASGLSRRAARSRINREAGSVFLLPQKSVLAIVGEIFFDVSLLIFLLTAIVSLCFEDGRASAVVVLVLLVAYLAIFGYHHFRARRKLEGAVAVFVPTVRVIRGGKLYCVDFRSVVMGDVILVEEGDVLACDARIVNSDSLRVRMRVDRERECVLDKQADGFVDPRERRAAEMVNMLHAGSVVEQGSARAIVTAVGRYTYIGAMTGGIAVPINEKQPMLLQKIRKQSMRLNLLMLLAVLPFTLISLIFSKLSGGNSFLSASFLTAIALCTMTLSPFNVLWLRLFYTHRMRSLQKDKNAVQIASVEAMERLAKVDYLFVTDGCAMSDGVLHFQAIATAQGEVRERITQNADAKTLCELVSLYHTAATGSMTTGVSGAGEYFSGLHELIARCGVDKGALRIRCSILSYLPANLNDSCEHVSFSDRGVKQMLSVSCSPRMLAECGSVLLDGVKQEMTAEIRAHLECLWLDYSKRTRAPLIFMLSDPMLSGKPCFVGMVVLREGVDPKLSEHIAQIEKNGCRVISFVPTDSTLPKLPDALIRRGVVSKHELVRNGMPLTHRFGKIRTYSDFTYEDILTLLKYARAKKCRVTVLGFGGDAAALAEDADALVTCAPLTSLVWDGGEAELSTLEMAGRQDSASCTQEQKTNAEYLVERPCRARGGLGALAGAMHWSHRTEQTVAAFWQYLIFAHFLRLLIVALPTLIGHTALDARHVIFLGCVTDAFAFAIFLFGAFRFAPTSRRVESAPTVWSLLRSDRPMLIASLSAGAACLILPQVLGLTGLTDRYIYTTEFTFLALILLQFVQLICALSKREDRETSIFRCPWLWAEVATLGIFLLLCAVWQPFGDCFGWERNPLPYALLSLAPALIFWGVHQILCRFTRKKEREM